MGKKAASCELRASSRLAFSSIYVSGTCHPKDGQICRGGVFSADDLLLQLKLIQMRLTNDNTFKKLIVIGDRVLIRPSKANERTDSGLYLPPGVQEKEKVQQGYVIKTGPGYAIPMPVEDESWKGQEEKVKYIPLQAKEGDLAVFLVSGATEVLYESERYYIVPQSAILMLEREEEM